jgi:hypothetical protein
MTTRKFIASSELFSNFQVDISLYEVNSINEIIKIFVNSLKDVLEKNNLTILIKKLEESKFHIHGYTIEEILVSNYDSIFYICDHR